MSEESIVLLYSRLACGLCDRARAVIQEERERSEIGFRFTEIMIDLDEGLERRYGLRVPVVEVDGREEFEFAVDPERLRSLVGRGRG